MILLLSTAVLAEGFFDTNYLTLSHETILYIDVLEDEERIYWFGVGDITLTSPDGTNTSTLGSGSSVITDSVGVWTAQLTSDQSNRFNLSVKDPQGGGDTAYEGRVFSHRWIMTLDDDQAEYEDETSTFYIPVAHSDTESDVVYQIELEGFDGDTLEVMANNEGGSEHPGWSIDNTLGDPQPLLRLYLSPPFTSGAFEAPGLPTLGIDYESSLCEAVLPGYAKATVQLTPTIAGGTIFGCSLETSDGFDFSSGSIDHYFDHDLTDKAEKTATWELEGFDASGDPLAPGKYTCSAQQLVAPVHVLINGASTLSPGLGIFLVSGQDADQGNRPMVWNDSRLLEGMDSADLKNKTLIFTEGEGLMSGSPLSTGNAHEWGNFTVPSRGDNGWVNTWSYAASSDITTASLSIASDEDDADEDGLSDGIEACLLGTEPGNDDTDNDHLPDADEVGADVENPADRDGDGVIDAIDDDDDGDGVPTQEEIEDTSDAGLLSDIDRDGKANWHDDDADGDEITDGEEDEDADGNGVQDYLEADPHSDTGQASLPQGDFAGGAFRCSSSGAGAAAMLPLLVAAFARRRRQAGQTTCGS